MHAQFWNLTYSFVGQRGKTSQRAASQAIVAHGHPSNSISRGSCPREAFHPGGAACNVTQPTLSGRIRQLEQELGVPIVERGQRYIGLTPEGERVLKWAHLILDNWQSLNQELAQIKGKKGELVGRLVLGVVPSALPMVSQLTKAMQAAHPSVDFSILSHSSEDIIRALA